MYRISFQIASAVIKEVRFKKGTGLSCKETEYNEIIKIIGSV